MTSAKLAELLGEQVTLLSEYAHKYDMMPNDIAYMSEAMAALATCLQKLLEANPGTNQTSVSPDSPAEARREPDRTSFESKRDATQAAATAQVTPLGHTDWMGQVAEEISRRLASCDTPAEDEDSAAVQPQ